MKKYLEILDSLKENHRFRELPPHRDPNTYLDLCSNDYMGLRWVSGSSEDYLSSAAGSSSASRLLAIEQNCYSRLEKRLGEAYSRKALLFNSGYHANTGIIQALGIPGTLFIADKLIHASAIDGLRLSGAEFKRFPHNDVSAVRRILDLHGKSYERIWILIESIYSMDGDAAPLPEFVKQKKIYPNLGLYVDEAHGFGVRGKFGLGLCEEAGVLDDVDIIIGTFGKAACSMGAFAAADAGMIDYIRNCARSFIFSTALPPFSIERSERNFNILMGMEKERIRLQEISAEFRNSLRGIGYNVPDGDSPIVPLLTGTAERAIELSRALEKENILALPIRRPTVPPGGERIRFSLNARLSNGDIEKVLKVMKKLA